MLVLFNDIEESSFSTVTLASAAIAGELARHAHNNFAGIFQHGWQEDKADYQLLSEGLRVSSLFCP
uniref:Uncharacterized protein n=1 Tax=Enterobacter cloacae TaxID=550 RepID=A0A886QME4_ENTCL|nr:hypothetical protein JJQ61_00030 [Enterobacter cloacae]